ncbi:MAG TPA: electron transfer flavoprotein subunit beta/FixA family protein [Actinomycetes bacterium]|nr:electron transfer flavoprotein subunit beta/FixA family protein [Actinomycetes bacterium]
MDVLVCIKRVPAGGGKFVLTEDEQDIETARLGFAISPHEEVAVEEAVRLVEAHGGSVTVLTLGTPESEEQIREQMAIGADRGILLETDGQEWDPQATASAIADAINADESPFDLVLMGNESADASGYQVGIRVAHALGRPVVTGVKAITIADGRMTCERPTTSAREVYEVPLPAVVTVLDGLNVPRYPSVPGRIRAKKKPIERSTPERPEPRLEKTRLMVPQSEGKQAKVLGTGPEAAPAVVEVLKQIGVV